MHTKSKTNWRPSRPIALAAAAIMALAGQALGQISGELNRWHKITLTIDGPSTSETADPNPFRDLRLNVAFTHPASGTTYLVPGYFAADGNAANTSASSGNRWRAHLCPDRTGTWNYTISFRQGADVSTDASPTAGSALAPYDGMSGTFSIAETDKGGRDLRGKGMLQYVGGRYLRFAGSGEHFLKQGADDPTALPVGKPRPTALRSTRNKPLAAQTCRRSHPRVVPPRLSALSASRIRCWEGRAMSLSVRPYPKENPKIWTSVK